MSILRLVTQATPVTPPAGRVTIFVDSADGETKQIDSNGVVTSLAGSGQTLYDGVDSEANILASSATTRLNQTWWAIDTKLEYTAVTVEGVDVWQGLGIRYDADSDAFCLPPAQDGQVQNLGQETFFLAYNNNGNGADKDEPKVFISVGSRTGDEIRQNVLLAVAGDLSAGRVFGLNTTDLQPGDKGKVTTYGEVRDVNTSAWNVNDLLYVDPTTAGELTNVQPGINAYIVGKVLKADATTGIIFVSSIASSRVDTATLPVGTAFAYLTGETVTPDAVTFYRTIVDDPGTVPSVTELVAVPDNSTVAAAQDHLSDPVPIDTPIFGGLRVGQIEFMIDQAGANERIYFELYAADPDGVVIDSGITGELVGDLGVRPIAVLRTSLLDADAGDVFKEEVRGQLLEDYLLLAGNRIRTHILCEKIGTAGGTKTFTLYFGSDHDSYIESIAQFSFLDLNDTPSSYSGQAGKLAVVDPTESGLVFTSSPPTSGDGAQIQTCSLVTAGNQAGGNTGFVKAVAFWVSRSITVSDIDVEVMSASAGEFIIGVYAPTATPNQYTLIGRAQKTMSGADAGTFVAFSLDAPIALTEGRYYFGFLNPQTGGANPQFASLQITNNNLRHAFRSTEQSLEDVPATINAQNIHSDMIWCAIG